MTTEIECVFRTSLPEQYHVPDVPIQLSGASNAKDLTKIVQQLLIEEANIDEKEVKQRKLNFLVENTFLSSSLQAVIDQLNITSEKTLEIYYMFALDKPKPKHSMP